MMKETLYLPHELITLILLRLPVKSLLRFKCVCKSWFSLISDSSFANSHFQLTAATHDPRIMLVSILHHESRSIDFETSFNHYSTSINLDFLPPLYQDQSDFFIEMPSSCRGFIFLECRPNFYLWNPSTGFHKQIPPFVSNTRPDFFYLCGFGYDESTDDYLVVSMSRDLYCFGYDESANDYLSTEYHLNIFSLRANTWKEIECPALLKYRQFPYLDHSGYEQREGFLCNGTLHWLASHVGLREDVIFAFHLMERQLFEMSFPNDFNQDPTDADLWVFGEFLSLSAMEHRTVVNIWVMKEYNVHSSWTKTLVLSIVDNPTRYFFPVCCTKSGEIIGSDGRNGLVKYDDKGQLLEHHSYCNDPEGSEVVVYVESLLSLPCES